MTLCTECYIQKDNKTLMLYRNKKKNDINKGKWIGIGGKFQHGESPEQCLVREVKEETNLQLTEYKLRGMVTFKEEEKPDDVMYIFIYIATGFSGELASCCDEGELAWIDDNKLMDLELWEGDRLFWDWLLNSDKFFSASFTYGEGKLVEHQEVFY